jgi:hypothetical protein
VLKTATYYFIHYKKKERPNPWNPKDRPPVCSDAEIKGAQEDEADPNYEADGPIDKNPEYDFRENYF